MESGTIEALVAGYDAWNRRDIDATLELVDPEIEWSFSGGAHFPGTDLVYHGHDGVREFWATFLEPWPELQIEVEEFRDAGEDVVALVRFRATAAASGIDFDVPFAHVCRLRDGKLLRFHAYGDSQEALHSVGL
jgi:uncharacterized protein